MQMTEQNAQSENEQKLGVYRPQLALYHPNGKGSGGAAKFELHPAHNSSAGCVMLKMAAQSAVACRAGEATQFARFDWENAITVKLEFADISAMLQVFNGECESLGEGRGLYHRSAKAATKIAMRHIVEPKPGYSLDLYRTLPGGQETSSRFFFSPAEALGLTEAVCGSMAVICFGIPMAQTASAERAESAAARRGKEAVDAAAA